MKIFYFSNKLSIFSKYFEVSDVIEPRTAMNSLMYWIDIQPAMVKEKGHPRKKMSLCAQSLQIIEPLLMTYIRFLNLWNGIKNGIDK